MRIDCGLAEDEVDRVPDVEKLVPGVDHVSDLGRTHRHEAVRVRLRHGTVDDQAAVALAPPPIVECQNDDTALREARSVTPQVFLGASPAVAHDDGPGPGPGFEVRRLVEIADHASAFAPYLDPALRDAVWKRRTVVLRQDRRG